MPPPINYIPLNQGSQILNATAKLVNANLTLVAAIEGLQQVLDDYNAVNAATPLTDAMLTACPALAFLAGNNAYNPNALASAVLPAIQQVYTDTANYTSNGGRNKTLMDLCQP
jgi:hypothetical protein